MTESASNVRHIANVVRSSDDGRKIIEGLQDAVRGNVTRVTIDGQVWVRHDVGSPEHELSTARAMVAALTERVDVLEAALRGEGWSTEQIKAG